MHGMDWDDLRFFLAVARAGSASGAADKLGVNHSTVSRRIAAFEKHLGVRLFDRVPGGFALTSDGEEILHAAENVEKEVDTVGRRLSGRDGRLTGVVRVATADAIAMYLLLPHFAAFRTQYPGIQLQVVVSNQLASLTKREADVAIRATAKPPEALVGRRIAKLGFTTYGERKHLERVGFFDGSASLDWIGFDSDEPPPAAIQAHLPPLKIVARVNDVTIMLEAIRLGMGVGGLPCFIGDQQADLMRITPLRDDFSLDLWLLTHEDLRDVARYRTFLDFMAEALRRQRDLLEGRRLFQAEGGAWDGAGNDGAADASVASEPEQSAALGERAPAE